MDDLYREQILDHSRSPRNYGELPGATMVQEEHNPFCGDRITLYLLVEDDAIKDVRFKGEGCAISRASASLLTEELRGMSTGDAKAIDRQVVLDLLGLPIGPVRTKCALLVLKALKAGLYGVAFTEDEEQW